MAPFDLIKIDHIQFGFEEDSSFTTKSDDRSVAFKIRCTSDVSKWVVFPGTTPSQPLGRTSQLLIETSVLVNHDQFGCAEEMLDRELLNWPLPALKRRELIDRLLHKAQEMVKCMPPRHNSAEVHFRVYLASINLIDGHRERIRLLMQRSMEEDASSGMIPAEESSIESLEKKTYTGCGGMTTADCSVCLEEILLGCEVTSMPCSHVFHGVCIEKWLRTSRYCPVCRFEMPTS